jgi:acyl-homoserine lactone acylase PvdQ
MVKGGKIGTNLLSLLSDVVDPYAKAVLAKLSKTVVKSEFLDVLKAWDGSFDTDSEAATLYTIFLYKFYYLILEPVVNENMKDDLIDNHLDPHLIMNCENCEKLIQEAFTAAEIDFKALGERKWGSQHILRMISYDYGHTFLRLLFDTYSPSAGNSFTIHSGAHSYSSFKDQK